MDIILCWQIADFCLTLSRNLGGNTVAGLKCFNMNCDYHCAVVSEVLFTHSGLSLAHLGHESFKL